MPPQARSLGRQSPSPRGAAAPRHTSGAAATAERPRRKRPVKRAPPPRAAPAAVASAVPAASSGATHPPEARALPRLPLPMAEAEEPEPPTPSSVIPSGRSGTSDDQWSGPRRRLDRLARRAASHLLGGPAGAVGRQAGVPLLAGWRDACAAARVRGGVLERAGEARRRGHRRRRAVRRPLLARAGWGLARSSRAPVRRGGLPRQPRLARPRCAVLPSAWLPPRGGSEARQRRRAAGAARATPRHRARRRVRSGARR